MPDPIEFRCGQCDKESGDPCVSVGGIDLYHHARKWAAEELDDAQEALAELALLYGGFIIGRWAEVMASDDEPADDWQERAAREAVDLFAPAAERFKRAVKAAALEEAADDLEMKRGMGGSAFQWDHGLLSIASTTRTLRNRAAAYREGSSAKREGV